MLLEVKRFEFGPTYTVGKLYIDGVEFCYTLEDRIRANGEKVAGETAIPEGTYKVVLSLSNRFKIVLPELLDVPNFKGVRVHAGNSSADTDGCILVGSSWTSGDWILSSKKAKDSLMEVLQKVSGPITIKISKK